jgi:uroporphyrinogen III methyltransferase/synthase
MSEVMSAPPRTVMITRPTGQAVELVAAIRAAGLLAVEFPLLEIRPVSDTSALHAALSALERYALVVFVSPNAIDQVMAYRDTIGVAWPRQVPLGVMGPGSVRALAQWGIAAPRYQVIAPAGAQAEVVVAPLDATHEVARDDAHELAARTPASATVAGSTPTSATEPSTAAEPAAEPSRAELRRAEAWPPSAADDPAQDAIRYDSEALLEALDQRFHLDTLAGREVLLVRGDGGREVFAETLRAMGVIVTTVTAYHRSAPQPTQAQWQALAAQLDQAPERLAWLFTSSEGVRYLNDLARTALNPAHYAALKRSQAIAPHARIAETARNAGFATITLSGAGERNIVNALLAWATAELAPPAAFPAPPLASSQTTQLVSRRMTDTHDTPLDPQAGAALTGAVDASKPAATLSNQAGAPPKPGLSATEAPRRDPLGAGSGPDAALPVEPSAATGGQRAVPWIILLIVVLAAGGGAYALNRKLDRAEHAWGQRQDASDMRLAQVAAQAHELDSQFAQISSKVQDAQSAEQALQEQYQDLARNRDDWTLAEIGQMLSTASEQLQLTGNVQLALFALQSADARLAASTGPQMLGVRRAVQQDIEKLKATPQIDLAGMAIKLDDAIAQVDTLPLLGEEKAPTGAAGTALPASSESAVDDAHAGWKNWTTQVLLEAGRDLKSLIQVRRIDDPDAMLVAPDQGYFLRANLKLRLLSARLSLLARDQATLKSDLNSANAAVNRYFDPTSKRVQTVHNLLQQVDQQSANVALPDMSGSLTAVRQFKSRS